MDCRLGVGIDELMPTHGLQSSVFQCKDSIAGRCITHKSAYVAVGISRPIQRRSSPTAVPALFERACPVFWYFVPTRLLDC